MGLAVHSFNKGHGSMISDPIAHKKGHAGHAAGHAGGHAGHGEHGEHGEQSEGVQPNAVARELALRMERHVYSPGDIVIAQGVALPEIYLIEKGAVAESLAVLAGLAGGANHDVNHDVNHSGDEEDGREDGEGGITGETKDATERGTKGFNGNRKGNTNTNTNANTSGGRNRSSPRDAPHVYVEESCVTQHHITPGIYPLYTFIAVYSPICTRYTCIYTIYTPLIHL